MLFQLHYQEGYSFETMRSRVKCPRCEFVQTMKEISEWSYQWADRMLESIRTENSLSIDKTKH